MLFSRYLLKNYLLVLLLCVSSFIAILLVSRLQEIAHFSAMGAKFSSLLLFILYQIPYILPIALPLSCLISSFLLFQRLCHTQELTALRAGGLSLKRLITPLLFASTLLAGFTFYTASELATSSHLAARKMVYDLSSVNPLLLLQSSKVANLKDAFIQMDPVRNGKKAKDLIIALNHRRDERLTLCLVKEMQMKGKQLLAKEVSVISTVPVEGKLFDHLLIENQKQLRASSAECAHLIRKSGLRIANDYLKFRWLWARISSLKEKTTLSLEQRARALNKCYSEIVRRVSLALVTITFTLMGAAFGIEMPRTPNRRGLLGAIFLATGCLIVFFIGKALSHLLWASLLLFLAPHVLISLLSLYSLQRFNQGRL